MGFFSKLVKHAKKDIKRSTSVTKKVAMRPIKDANKVSRKVGGPQLPTRLGGGPKQDLRNLKGMMGKPPLGGGRGGARKAPPVSAGGPAPRPTSGMARPVANAMRRNIGRGPVGRGGMRK